MDSRHVKIAPSSKEIGLHQRFFNEASYMGGTHIKYRAVKSHEITSVSSDMYQWVDPIEMDVIYDERPKVSLLKRLNWYSEDTTIQPRIVYLPAHVCVLSEERIIEAVRGDLILVPNPLRPQEDSIFQISEVRTELLPVFWICNIVPFRKQVQNEVTPTLNNKWLNT